MKKHAVMLYVIKDNKILFLVRNKKNDTVHRQGMLLSIGGKVEKGESIENAVTREAMEEASIVPQDIELRAIMHFPNFGTEKNDWISFLFTCTKFKGTPRTGPEGHFVWENIVDINTLNLYEQDKIY